ncbi:MAG: hypothetical protein ACW986_18240 [Promethearchaeota archaeon]
MYFFVENPISLRINKVPLNNYIAEPLLHPSHPEKGRRKIKCVGKNNQLDLLVSTSDTEKMESGQIIRLKDLMNIRIESVNLDNNLIESTFHSKELSRKFSIIQWVPIDEKIQVSILNPDGSLSEGFGEINLLRIPMNRTIQFERFGFVNPIELKENCLFCYFTH